MYGFALAAALNEQGGWRRDVAHVELPLLAAAAGAAHWAAGHQLVGGSRDLGVLQSVDGAFCDGGELAVVGQLLAV